MGRAWLEPHVAMPHIGPQPVRKTAKILTHRRFNLEALRAEYRTTCADTIEKAFPASSPNACAIAASLATGIPRDTIYRILRLETHVPDITAVIACLRCSPRDGDGGLKAYALLMKIMAVQS